MCRMKATMKKRKNNIKNAGFDISSNPAFFARTREDTEQLHFFFILSLRDEPVLFAVLP